MKKEGINKEKKEVGFITVINSIVGVILVIFSISTLIMKLFLPAVLFLIFAVFIFFPQKILKFNKWIKLLIVILGFFLILIIIGFNSPKQNPEFVNYNLNEEFIISYNKVNFSMIVYNSTKEEKILVGGEEKTTNGIFLVITGSVNNLGDTSSGFTFSSALLDSQNRTYSLYSANLGEGAIQPGIKRDFINVFEIPKEISGLKFFVGDETNIFRLISLGF